jgi:hypothetical protein
MLHHIITKPSHDRDGALSRRRSPHYVAFATAMLAATNRRPAQDDRADGAVTAHP